MYTPHTKETFSEKSKVIHGDRYDYSLVSYKNNRIKVKIICPIHGVFEQTPDAHLSGKGCRKCALSKMGRKKPDRIRSRYKGVGFDNTNKKWVASIFYNGEDHILGRFNDEEEAGMAYKNATIEIRNPQPIVDLDGEMWIKFIEKGCNYAVSNMGRIKSFNYQNMGFESLMTQRINGDGYLTISFRGGMVRVHTLMAKYFIGNKKEGHVVNHIDGHKRNNVLSNLEYITVRSNNYHSLYLKNGTVGVRMGGDGRYLAAITINGKNKILGRFINKEDAFSRFLEGLLQFGLKEDYDYVKALVSK
jgi:hypothetical protein